MLAHLRTVSPVRAGSPRVAQAAIGAALGGLFLLAVVLAGCGFSGALYLPDEPPPAPAEQAAPEETGAEPEASPT